MGAFLQDEGALGGCQHLAGDVFHLLRVVLVEQHQNELVTAHSAGDVAGTNGVLEAARHLHQHLVTGLVAQRVIDGLVAVQVDVEHGQRLLVFQLLFQSLG